MNLPHDYDDWKLNPPEQSAPGMEEGDTCNRIAEPDEDAPRGYRPKPCSGTMTRTVSFDDRHLACDTCGEIPA